ncbi:MAG: SpoIIE family protein phosphatase [Prevotella sp.]|nr:SpoIIE family protein phosphatase [Prevotella sp.]MBR3078530.1 SpoIIE family protein phosphatase [Prevotella sp.]
MAIKILCVDDEAPIDMLMKQYFRRKIRSGEYEFLFARNGLEALAILYNNPDIEIILSDINMPEMDGLTLLAKVNEMRNPALRVIMVSAYGDMQNIRQAMNNGAFDFATKPIDMDDLAVTIEKAIEQIHFVHESQKEHTQLESLKKDLTTARDIQQYILPQVFPPFPEDTGLLDIYASMVAAKDIGGDFYDFFRIDADRIALVIADVCGKGIPAALFMAVSRTIIRSKGTQCDNAAECITETNRLLAAYSVDCMFVTAFYAIYNIKTGQLNYCNAGHNPPYLIKADGKTEELPMPTDVIVGAFDEIKYEECTMQMDHGDTLVMFTDGVPEAMNPDLEEFGTDRLCNILSGMADKCCKEIIETIKASIDNFAAGAEQSDDITMLVLKRK